MAVLRWLMVLVLLVAMPASAAPTRSGKLKGFTPGQADFILIGEDGKEVKVRLNKNTRYEICGRASASSAFRDGMQVAVRVVGALNEKPLQADMMMDLYSSRNHVQTTAHAPYLTPQGDFAFPGGVGGLSAGTPNITHPNVLGQLAHGGNHPGSTSNPNPGQLPNDPVYNTNNELFPVNQAHGVGPNGPSPSGSPMIGEAVNTMGPTPGSTAPPYTTMPSTGTGGPPQQGGYYQPPAQPQPGGYYQQGFNQPMQSSAMMGNGDPQMDVASAQAQMMSGHDEDDPENDDTGMITSQMKGPQVVQWNARVVQIDSARRMLVVQPAGMPSPQNVLVPPSVAIPAQALQPGAFIQVIGMANAAGFVEAQSIQPLEGQPR